MKKRLVSLFLVLFGGFFVSAQTIFQNNDPKWVYGGSVGFSVGDDIYGIQLSPKVGYTILPDLVLGATINYTFQQYNQAKSSVFGIGPTLHYYSSMNYYLHTSFQHFFVSQKNQGHSISIREKALYVGGGYLQRISDNVSLQIGAVYNLLYNKEKSIFSSGFSPNIGIIVGL